MSQLQQQKLGDSETHEQSTSSKLMQLSNQVPPTVGSSDGGIKDMVSTQMLREAFEDVPSRQKSRSRTSTTGNDAAYYASQVKSQEPSPERKSGLTYIREINQEYYNTSSLYPSPEHDYKLRSTYGHYDQHRKSLPDIKGGGMENLVKLQVRVDASTFKNTPLKRGSSRGLSK